MKRYTIIFLVLILFSCSKNIEDDYEYHFPVDWFEYFFFPTGSWWVYSINDTITDSIVIDNENYNLLSDQIQKYLLVYSHYLSDSLEKFYGNHSFKIERSSYKWILFSDLSTDNYYWSFPFYFFKSDFVIGERMNGHIRNYDTMFIEIADTSPVVLKTGKIKNSDHIKVYWGYHKMYVPGYSVTDIWFSKQIGLTKLKFYDSTEIELKKYQIKY